MAISIVIPFSGMEMLGQSNPDFPSYLEWKAVVSQHDFERYSYLTREEKRVLNVAKCDWQIGNAKWKLHFSTKPWPQNPKAFEVSLTFHLVDGQSSQTRLSLELEEKDWLKSHYLVLPSAAYNGNRFDYRRIAYSPKILDPRDIGPEKPTLVSDVPKLNFGDGPSRIQERSGSMASPSVGYFNEKKGESVWLFIEQGNALGDYGLNLEENRERNKLTLALTSPLVREGHKYRITDNRFPSNDRAHDFSKGDSIRISAIFVRQECRSVSELYQQYFMLRNKFGPQTQAANQLSFSQAFAVQENKFNKQNFVKSHGYYSVGMRENFLQDWQIGWTGGMISTYPLLVLGADSTRKNVIRNFDWLFTGGISPSGFFWDSGEKGTQWYGGDIRKPHTKNWHLVRKSGDGLYFVIKQFLAMPHLGIEPKTEWKAKTKGVADAFLKVWKKYGQLGQFVDNVSGEIQVGGSASGGIVPAAMVLAADYFKEPAYLEMAKGLGEYYYQNHIKMGVINGGPGDAMQNPDSESTYALLESYMALFEATQDKKWLRYAQETCWQFSSWVSSYNYQFPPQSLFGKIGIKSLGAVWANTQNKHGAPAICTHSGLGLLKLYSLTGDTLVLNLLRDIAHNMPQYMGTPGRPIPGVKDGWVCERVSTNDWLEGIGEITYQSTWAETGLMLTTLEIPGLFIEPEKQKLTAFDQVEARWKGKGKVEVFNPTKSPAKIWYTVAQNGAKTFQEGKYQTQRKYLELKAGERRVLKF